MGPCAYPVTMEFRLFLVAAMLCAAFAVVHADDEESDSGFCTGTGKVMMPGFQTATDGNTCMLSLFKGWVVDSPTKYVFAVLGTFCFAFFNEGFVFVRRMYAMRYAHETIALKAPIAVFYGIQMVFAYWLMLLVMTYEAWIFTAIITGLSAGHLVWSVIAPMYVAKHLIKGRAQGNDEEESLDIQGAKTYNTQAAGATPSCSSASA